MNNAVTRVGGRLLGEHAHWQHAVDVNIWGVINGVQAFVPAMVEQGTAGICRVGMSSTRTFFRPFNPER